MNNIGILGCGNIKAKIAETVNLMDDVDLFAVASGSLKKAEYWSSPDHCYGFFRVIISQRDRRRRRKNPDLTPFDLV